MNAQKTISWLKTLLTLALVSVLALTLVGCRTEGSTGTQGTEESGGAQAPGGGDQDPAMPEDLKDQPVELFLPNSAADGFEVKSSLTDGTAGHIVSLLVDEQALPVGSVLNSFTIAGARSATVDMNVAFGLGVKQTGTTGEYLIMGSLVNTLLTFFDLDEITLTVDGGTLETGHTIYEFPLRFFEDQAAL